MKINIHSIESFATLDGGGIRFAIFLQGCPLRCVYCHNPDTQQLVDNKVIEIDELVDKIYKNRAYYKSGGVTISGGEPLLQSIELLTLCRAIRERTGLHIAVDTSLSVIPDNFKELVQAVDLFIVDIKFYNQADYSRYCKGDIETLIRGLSVIDSLNGRVLARTVIIPTINDKKEDIIQYLSILEGLRCVEQYELLAYHTLGVYKYRELNREYQLPNIAPMDTKALDILQKYLDDTVTSTKTGVEYRRI